MDAASTSSGFSDHVLGQLNDMSQQVSSRGRGNRGRGQGPPRSARQQPHPSVPPQPQQSPSLSFTPNNDAFPPLGTAPSMAPRTGYAQPQGPQYQPPPHANTFNDPRHGTPRQYQELARGNYRGGRPFGAHQTRQQHGLGQHSQPGHPAQYSINGRPPPRHAQLYNPNAVLRYGTAEEQRVMRHAIIRQSDYLTNIARKAYDQHRITHEEKDTKEEFRLGLEKVARIELAGKYPDLRLDDVKLRCYGSLANGFALTNCDMDLLLELPEYDGLEISSTTKPVPDLETSSAEEGVQEGEQQEGFKVDVRRILEKVYLDHGYGARLLTQTRVPILRICQTPTPELLHNLRENRAQWENSLDKEKQSEPEKPEDPTSEDITEDVDAVEQAMTDMTITKQARPRRAGRGNEGLEFTDECGIQCDINFSNFVALHNSNLLRLYHGFDSRVKDVGVFVKIWAKTRDINTPYRGTLSSYGWILMVLHYLMNVAKPPVIPNLQYLAKIEDSWNPDRPIPLFEGFDVRFVQDSRGLQEAEQNIQANKNKESSGQLLRGFFQYYASHQGFHWTRDIISIRTMGGIITKQNKGWTEAKWQQGENRSVRNRYLVAIEDPFEIEHNIARTVGHHGIVTIRNEFRRAWAIVEKVGTSQQIPGDELLTPIEDRVDTLKKDQDHHRQRQAQLRKDAEAQEKSMLKEVGAEQAAVQNDEIESISTKLTSIPIKQVQKPSKPSGTWRRRKVSTDNEDEDEPDFEPPQNREGLEDADTLTPNNMTEPRRPSGALVSRADILLASGYDANGEPVAWDLDTQEGRWLHWRDHKIRKGLLKPDFQNAAHRELNEQCPYDPLRPNPYEGKPYRNRLEHFMQEVPPWPSNKPELADEPDSAATRAVTGSQTRAHLADSSEFVEPHFSPSGWSGSQSSRVDKTMIPHQSHSSLRETGAGAATVGSIIPWDTTTQGGRWLRSRDLRIRSGTWVESSRNGWYIRLSRACPYNPKMSTTELAEKNSWLRKHYMYAIGGHQDLLSEKALSAIDRRDLRDRGLSSHATEKRIARNLSSMSSNDQLLQPLSSLAGEPSCDTVSDIAPTTPTDNGREIDVDFVRNRRLSFYLKNMSATHSEVDTNADFYSAAAPTKVAEDSVETPVTVRHFKIPVSVPEKAAIATVSDVLAQSSHGDPDFVAPAPQHEYETEIELSDSPIREARAIRVPTTLYPGLDRDKRPRDEDPNVMPIPRPLGFQFDARQLQDLAVISKGGNGCAREGAEFSIEHDEYEWGGGGMMGYRTDTGPQMAHVSSGTPFEAGRGDEDGLLDELPRSFGQETNIGDALQSSA